MRTLVIVAIAIVSGLPASTAHAQVPMRRFAERHFDHAAHLSALAAKGVSAPPCARCHPNDTHTATGKLLDRDGAPSSLEHPFCAGSGCHGTIDARDVSCATLIAKDQEKVCKLCHVSPSNKCMAAVPAPNELHPAFTHGAHVVRGSKVDAACLVCHPAATHGAVDPKQPPHALCASCHAGSPLHPMTACEKCHTADALAKPAPALPSAFRVEPFAHGTHATKSHQGSCLACHGKPATSTPAAALQPVMIAHDRTGTCASCHDGKTAFATTGTTCTRCHQSTEPATKLAVDVPFSHATHDKRGVKIADCESCHAVTGDGSLVTPGAGKNHQPCAASGCHDTSDFASKEPKICGACHDRASPWAKTIARSRKPLVIEWSEGISHATHAKLGTANGNCETCHGDLFANVPMPRGHEACAQCHAKGQAPAMTACAACHTRSPTQRPAPSMWSVAASFQHATHGRDPRAGGSPTPCIECHTQITRAADLASIKPPDMARCDGCHDGKRAFKTTGFDCARCHQKPRAPINSALPAGVLRGRAQPGLAINSALPAGVLRGRAQPGLAIARAP